MSFTILINETISLGKLIEKKKLEIEKRKELISKMTESEVLQLKLQKKETKIDTKIGSQKQQLEAKIDYFRNEIRLREEKMEKEIRDARENFEKYRSYCHGQMEQLEKKFEGIIQGLECQKEDSVLSVSDDKILKRLEIEIQQLEDQQKTKQERALQLQAQEAKARQREALEEFRLQEEKIRMEDQRKREYALQMARIQLDREERERQQKRDQRDLEIQEVMKKHNCEYNEAYQIWSRPTVDPEEIQRQNRNEAMKELRKQYSQYKVVLNELDVEHQNKLIRLRDVDIVQFLETLKPQIELKLKFENDETWLDDEHQDLFQDLTLDKQFECLKIKDKAKRHKFLDKFKKSRVDKLNELHNCV
jgi:hypothetical protein